MVEKELKEPRIERANCGKRVKEVKIRKGISRLKDQKRSNIFKRIHCRERTKRVL